MIKELDNFIIESDIKLDYFDKVVNHIIENEKRILDFFKLDKLPNKAPFWCFLVFFAIS